MIDILTLALTHGLIALALWRMLFRADLDIDDAEAPPARKRWHRAALGDAEEGPGGA